jgi:hypothetical protein
MTQKQELSPEIALNDGRLRPDGVGSEGAVMVETGRNEHEAARRSGVTCLVALGALGCNAVLGIAPAELECRGVECEGASGPVGAVGVPSPGVPTFSLPGTAIADAGVGAAPPASVQSVEPALANPASSGAEATGSAAAIDVAEGTPPPAAEVTSPGTPAVDAGAPAEAAPSGPELDANGLAVALPNDLIDAPVAGEIVYSDEAAWEVNGVFQPTFEIHTPAASYWIVKPLGTMVSMQDASGGSQWIDFSSGFRPLRGVPALEDPPANVLTVRDQESQTPTHVRLTSESSDGAWQWVWDFYVTHATLTINRAVGPFGFAYRGVPGGSLGTEDRLVSSDGTEQGARNSFEADLPGPAEWAYLADTALGRSLFLVQHTDDELPESYQVRDNDSAHFSFGDGQIATSPIRFSLGLVGSADLAAVRARVEYVTSVIH